MHALCDIDSRLLKRTIEEFSKYLRGHIEILETENLIPFEKELDLVQNYLNLEKLRFQEDLRRAYDIQAGDFELPPLTLQPIVENAVKHGLMQKKGGGTVTIATGKNEKFYEIIVHDDGMGFVRWFRFWAATALRRKWEETAPTICTKRRNCAILQAWEFT